MPENNLKSLICPNCNFDTFTEDDIKQVGNQQIITCYSCGDLLVFKNTPFLHVSVDIEKMLKVMPPSLLEDEETKIRAIGEIIQQVRQMFENLKPDEAFVSTDGIKIEKRYEEAIKTVKYD